MPPRGRLSSVVLEQVQRALAQLDGAPIEPESPLRRALAALAEEARTQGVPPEEVLVAVKGIWNELPDSDHRSPGDRARALQRVVTMCIKEYYR